MTSIKNRFTVGQKKGRSYTERERERDKVCRELVIRSLSFSLLVSFYFRWYFITPCFKNGGRST